MRVQAYSLLPLLGLCSALLQPNSTSSAGVEVYNPGDFFNTTGPWSLMSRAGDTLYIAGEHFAMKLQSAPNAHRY
jgi:2-iminobutanoate/2-iminopropanoate deaminase